MASTPTPQPETTPEPPAEHQKKIISRLTPDYRKAHKNYVLVAALLASWELIGIKLDTASKWGVELLSPNAVPLILSILVFYFGYKVVIEWKESDDGRSRKSTVARFDYSLSHIIGASAILVGLVQYLTKIRIADYIAAHATFWQTTILVFYAVNGASMGLVLRNRQLLRNRQRLGRFWRIAVAMLVASVILGYLFKGWRGIVGAVSVIILLIVVSNLMLWVEYLFDWTSKRIMPTPISETIIEAEKL